MSDETIYTIFLIFNLLVYLLAFSVAYFKKQNIILYLILLGISLYCTYSIVYYEPSGSSDAAGYGMDRGYNILIGGGIQVICLVALIIIFCSFTAAKQQKFINHKSNCGIFSTITETGIMYAFRCTLSIMNRT
jgi:hypothetical protein